MYEILHDFKIVWLLTLLTAAVGVTISMASHTDDRQSLPHVRQKRFLWITSDGRLALPPGTTLVIAPSLSMPFIRHPPDGFFSNMTISLPFTIDFNKLGLTDNENPYGVIHPFLARSIGRAAGSLLHDYVRDVYLSRRKRSATSSTTTTTTSQETFPILTENIKHVFHGGERALLYPIVEDFLANFGMDGKACLLRAICEVHAFPVDHLGFVGEILKLFFTASKSAFSGYLNEYIAAEKMGSENHGDCSAYTAECQKSLFRMQQTTSSSSSQASFQQFTNDNDGQTRLQNILTLFKAEGE